MPAEPFPTDTPPGPVLYREATPDDLPTLCALGEEVNAVHRDALPTVFNGPGARQHDMAAHWASGIAQGGDATTFIATEGGMPVGFVMVAVVDETHPFFLPCRHGRIGTLGVTASRRGRGIGRGLMRQAEAWARDAGASEIRLFAWAFNQPALQLYQELGYDITLHCLGKRLPQAGD